MDEKDPKDEELNPQGQDDANEADDSFGLPDLDYKPLDEEEPTETDEEISSEDENVEPVAEEEVENNFSEETETEEESSIGEQDESEKPVLRYQMEEESSNAPKIIGGIIGVLALAAIVWYFWFYRPKQQKIEDDAKAKQEELDYKKAQEAEAARKKKAAADAVAAEQAREEAQVEETSNAEVQILSERSGRYYIVLESFIDADFAKDFGNKIAQEGTPSFLIPPYSKKKMQRVAVGGYNSMDEAQSALNDLPEEFGTGKWILKY